MARLDISWLGIFIEIYRARSVSGAAERLAMSQASVSGILNKLRRHFGDPLFARTSRGMQPTPYAEQIYPDVVQSYERLSSLSSVREPFHPATAQRDFRICMTDISEIVVLPGLVNELAAIAPGVSISAERISSDSHRRLEAGEVDLAVGYMPTLEAGFYQQTLFRQGFVCLAARRHPRIQAGFSRSAFSKEGHVVVTTSGTGHSIVEREFDKRGISRRIVLRVPSFLGVVRLVAKTELIATVPQRLAQILADQERVKMIDPPIPLPSYEVKLHWHRRFHADGGVVWLRGILSQLFGEGRLKRASSPEKH